MLNNTATVLQEVVRLKQIQTSQYYSYKSWSMCRINDPAWPLPLPLKAEKHENMLSHHACSIFYITVPGKRSKVSDNNK